jgi:AcrR family transcriptional regulator
MTSATPGLRERKKAQTHAAFIDAGLELFGERGYDAVTVEDICEVVGVSPRTFFRYFATKADLVIAELDRLLSGLLDDLRARPDSDRAWAALRHALLAVTGQITDRRKSYTVLHTVIHGAPDLVAGNAAALIDWERQMTEEVTRRLPEPARGNARLMTGIALTAFRVAVDAWRDGDGKSDLSAMLSEHLTLLQPAATRLARSSAVETLQTASRRLAR